MKKNFIVIFVIILLTCFLSFSGGLTAELKKPDARKVQAENKVDNLSEKGEMPPVLIKKSADAEAVQPFAAGVSPENAKKIGGNKSIPSSVPNSSAALKKEESKKTDHFSFTLVILFMIAFIFAILRERKSSKIHEVIKNGDLIKVKEMIENNPQLLNEKQYEGKTPLYTAVSLGKDEIAAYLISKGANINAGNQFEETPLHQAAEEGETSTVELLISKGADINAKSRFKETPLHLAANSGNVDVVSLLVDQGAEINPLSDTMEIPLHMSSSGEVTRLLIEKGAEIGAKDDMGETPLHSAADAETVIALIERGADVNAVSETGETPLHQAATAEVAQALIDSGANLNARNEDGYTPLHNAVMFGVIDVVETLIRNGADMEARDKFNQTPLILAEKENKAEAAELLKNIAGISMKQG